MSVNSHYHRIFYGCDSAEDIKCLLDKGAVPNIWQLVHSITYTNVDIVELLIKQVPANYHCFMEALSLDNNDYMDCRFIELIKLLLTNFELTDEEKENILEYSFNNNSFETYRLIRNNFFDDTQTEVEGTSSELLKEIKLSEKDGKPTNLTLIETLLENASCSELTEASEYCLKNGYLRMYCLIDEKTSIRFKCLSKFEIFCKMNGINQVLKYSPFVSKQMISKGIEACNQNKNSYLAMKLEEYLLANE